MERFTEFFKSFRENFKVVEEKLSSRIDELAETGIFSQLGREYIVNRFEEYKTRGVVPDKKYGVNASRASASRTIDRTDELIDLTEKDYEEILPYIFKFVDAEVRNKLLELHKEGESEKLRNKVNRHYAGVTVRDVIEDASQINGTLVDWIFYRNKGASKSPKSLRSKIDFNDLIVKVAADHKKWSSAKADKRSAGNPDFDIPKGWKFIREVNNMRLYKWNEVGDLLDRPKTEQMRWLSITKKVTGEFKDEWCVGDAGFRDRYGKPSGDTFRYPYYMIRKKAVEEVQQESAGAVVYEPYVLMHGDSLQCKDVLDIAITKDMADEIYPVVKGMLKEIVFADNESDS